MAKRNVIHIDETKCIGCGKCVNACHNSALKLVDGKAKLVGEVLCDGLGACIGECPVGALKIETREVRDEKPNNNAAAGSGGGVQCPGTMMRQMNRAEAADRDEKRAAGHVPSQLGNWPVQLKLVNPAAPYFERADILLAADCTAFAFGGFHEKLLAGKQLIIACPKLDDRGFYVEKLRDLFEHSRPASVTVARMEVPCCRGLLDLVYLAMVEAEVKIPVTEVTISLEGQVISERQIDNSLMLVTH